MKAKVFQVFIGILCISSALFLFLVLERWTHLATDGFAVVRMMNDLPTSQEYLPKELDVQEQENIENILSQPFYYFNSGGQSYIFISEDEKYVLKFFKFHHMRVPSVLKKIPLPKSLESYRVAKIQKKNTVLERTFKSYQIAFDHFKDKTALIFLHLQKTSNLNLKLHIVDKIGIHFDLNADDLAFAIQKKGVLAYKHIENSMAVNDVKGAEDAISEIIDVAILRCKRGIGDTDADFNTNFGFIDGSAAQIDMGRFHIDPNEKNPDVYIPEMHRITHDFRDWILKKHPVLVDSFDRKLKAIVDEQSQ